MGRNIGTNVYSNNFEPQVMGLLDARTRVDSKADLTKEATWTSSDGNTYAPVGIRVSVTDDSTSGNNGVYMLMSEDYAIASNWMKIGSEGSAELVMVDLSTVNTIPGTYTPDRYLMGEFIKIQDALSIDTPFFVYQFNAEFGQFQTTAIIDGNILDFSILYRDEIWLINFDGGYYTVAKADMGGGGGSSTSNVKVLTTPDLLNTSRTSSLKLSADDIAIIKGLTSKDILVYNGVVGSSTVYTPFTIMNTGSGTTQSYKITFFQAEAVYTFTIVASGNLTIYSASKLKKIEFSGSGESKVEFIDLSQIAAQNDTNVPASESLKTELDKIYSSMSSKIPFANWFDNVEGGYPISVIDYLSGRIMFTVLFNSELWMVDYDSSTSTYSTTKVESSGGSGKAEIVELPSDASANLPYENGDYMGDNLTFANKIREISINPTNNYVLKYSPTGYYTVINPYRASSYAGFYIATSEGENLHIYTSTITSDSSYTIQSEGSYMLKQDTLVSGKNIKTINGQSLLGSGNIAISGSGGADVLKVSLYDLSPRNGTYTVSLGDYSYDSIIELNDSRSSGKVMYAYEFNGEMGMFNISLNDLEEDTLYLDYLNKKIKVEYTINGDNTITCIITDVTKYDLSLDVRISNNKIQYRIHEVAPNGYICFYRKKRCRNSITDRPHVNKYTIPDFYFSSKIGTLGFPAIKKKYMIPASNAQLNTWTDFPMEVLKVFSTNSTTSVGFTGTVHATPCNKDTATNNWDKWVTVLNMGLAYNVVNPNFINGIKENNAYPTDIIQSGDMVKFKCRLMVPYELRYTMY